MDVEKASASDFLGRFREIVSDPINLKIHRDERAGIVRKGWVTLHNGVEVRASGPLSYYGKFSQILVINRGVHEPLEEYCFSQWLSSIQPNSNPVMVECGAYWGHYSMWLQRCFPIARNILIEPSLLGTLVGKLNFSHNRMSGDWIKQRLGRSAQALESLLDERGIDGIDMLHVDIQGAEKDFFSLDRGLLSSGRVRVIFVSTHSQELHSAVAEMLLRFGFRIEVESDWVAHTTSHDGLIVASHETVPPIFGFKPSFLGRVSISQSSVQQLVSSLAGN